MDLVRIMVIHSMSNFDQNKTQCNHIWSLQAQISTVLILLVIRPLGMVFHNSNAAEAWAV